MWAVWAVGYVVDHLTGVRTLDLFPRALGLGGLRLGLGCGLRGGRLRRLLLSRSVAVRDHGIGLALFGKRLFGLGGTGRSGGGGLCLGHHLAHAGGVAAAFLLVNFGLLLNRVEAHGDLWGLGAAL